MALGPIRAGGNSMMISKIPRCLGNYDFDHIAWYAKKRFVDGWDTVALLEQATSEREREEIALVCLLDVADDEVRNLQLCCVHAKACKVMDCRDRLKRLIAQQLGRRKL